MIKGSSGAGGGAGYPGGKGGIWVLKPESSYLGVGSSGTSYIANKTFTDYGWENGDSINSKYGDGQVNITKIFSCSSFCYSCISSEICQKCEVDYYFYNSSYYSEGCPKRTYLANSLSKILADDKEEPSASYLLCIFSH